ncbi:M48 family metalloprotease [Desulfosarcina sp.]|nr:M48 family metalloprotease [Desulfosarcina sp.]
MIKYFRISLFLILIFSLNGIAQDLSYDKKMGAEGAKQVEQAVGIYQDSALTAYVNQVGARLVDALGDGPFEFRFSVVEMAEPNAFALPGGYIYVSRGLLSLVNDEAELAGVIGHEMIHVTKRHSVKQMKKSIFPSLLQVPGAIVGVFNSNLGKAINAPFSLGSELFLSNYSRKQESESDEFGIRLASKAGYDPEKLAVMLNNLSADVELLTGEEEKKSYFSTHPITPKRVEDIGKEIPKLEWSEKTSIAPDKESLYTKLEGMVIGQNPAHGIFDENVFKHPDLDLAITFPEKWETVNVPVAVGAAQEDGEAQLVFMVDNSGGTPDSLGAVFTEMLQKEYKLKPDKSEPMEINGFPAYKITLVDKSGKQPVDIQIYWLKAGDILFNVMGMSYLKYSESMANTVNSVRPLTEDEKQNISGLKLHHAIANENENLEAFSKRTNNIWDPKTTAVKNGLETNTLLKEGQVLKIAVEESYF